MKQLSDAVAAVQRRVTMATWAGALLRQGAGLLALIGVCVVVMRLAGVAGPWGLAPLGALSLLPLSSWARSRSSRISAQDAAAWLDREQGGDGSLVSAQELGESPSLAVRVPGRLPVLRLGGAGRWAAAGGAFCALCLVLPIEPLRAGPLPPDSPQVQALAEQLETLEEVLALEEEQQESLEEAVEELRDEQSRANPEAALEAMDALESRLEELALSAQQAAEQARAAMDAAQEAAEQAEAQGLSPQEQAEAQAAKQAAAEQAAQAMAEAGMQMPEGGARALEQAGLSQALSEQLSVGQVSAEQLSQALSQLSAQQLAAAQQAMSAAQAQQLAELARAGLAKEGQGQGEGEGQGQGQGEGQGQGQGEGQGQGQGEGQGQGQGEGQGQGQGEGQGQGQGEGAGQGGTSRGPGSAAITYGEERPDQSERFTPTRLAPGELDLASSALVGEGRGDAQVHVVRGADGVSATVVSSGQDTNRRRLAPSHQQAVSTWFEVEQE